MHLFLPFEDSDWAQGGKRLYAFRDLSMQCRKELGSPNLIFLCETSVFSVSLWSNFLGSCQHHRDTENTENTENTQRIEIRTPLRIKFQSVPGNP
jgi:hypothetical protein